MNAKQTIKKMLDIVNERNTIKKNLKAERTKAVNRKTEAEKKLVELGANADMKSFKDLRNEVRDAQDEIDLYDMKLSAMKQTDNKTKAAFRTERDELAKYLSATDRETAQKIREHALEIVKLFSESIDRQNEINSIIRKYADELGIPAGECGSLAYNGITSKTLILALKNQAANTAATITADGKVTGY